MALWRSRAQLQGHRPHAGRGRRRNRALGRPDVLGGLCRAGRQRHHGHGGGRDAAAAWPHGVDIYLFAYGHDFKGALRDFYHLSGSAPALPRYALGNWWSRFNPYTEQSYRALMERFGSENVPLSVAVLDMNWHVTDIDPRYGPGWTGYTWNREMFPDPPRLLKWLHERGLKVTLNDHPADGVRAFDDLYPAMAEAMGVDPATEAPVPFDAGSPKYLEAFEKVVLDDFEKQGVDFWWIDWQQKGGSSVRGIDPLFMLNHTRYLYSARKGDAGLTFSRYAGPGSHRYPVGFSGDSFITWDSLAFQPYFTATAANIGYGWWSHDIGGHMHGIRDEELQTRWLQFGVLSPIMRLHACNSVFLSKEPWAYPEPYCSIMKRWLRFRHALLPWLYTKNVEGSQRGLPILYPVYYDWPDDYAAYDAQRDEYLFGGELLVAPVTSPAEDTGLAHARAWLPPEAQWIDFTTGHRYPGGQALRAYRSLSEVPIFVRPGTVIPMDGADMIPNGGPLPETLLFRAFAGASGGCHVVEDNGKAQGNPDCRSAETRFAMDVRESMTVMISPPLGDRTIIPENRRYVVELVGVENRLPDEATCALESSYDERTRTLRLELAADALTGATLRWRETPVCPPLDKKKMLEEALLQLRMNNDDKDRIMDIASAGSGPSTVKDGTCRIAAWRCLDLPDSVMGLLEELEIVR
ncbi:MAG: alpha-xylosidase [Clostridia bacterium]|nr:alpha-xylosidase [Clostridia bacterium]